MNVAFRYGPETFHFIIQSEDEGLYHKSVTAVGVMIPNVAADLWFATYALYNKERNQWYRYMDKRCYYDAETIYYALKRAGGNENTYMRLRYAGFHGCCVWSAVNNYIKSIEKSVDKRIFFR